jgi:catechol 2,3-dioxygenase-like lactoylglutathione lyase family enzyme
VLSHTTLGVTDLPRALKFYAPLMEALGLTLKFSDADWAAWRSPGVDRPLFIVARPFDGQAASAGIGQMIALLAASRAVVDRCHALALEHGGTDEGLPGLRPAYHPNYYGAYFRDLDGNKLCVCRHEPEQEGPAFSEGAL